MLSKKLQGRFDQHYRIQSSSSMAPGGALHFNDELACLRFLRNLKVSRQQLRKIAAELGLDGQFSSGDSVLKALASALVKRRLAIVSNVGEVAGLNVKPQPLTLLKPGSVRGVNGASADIYIGTAQNLARSPAKANRRVLSKNEAVRLLDDGHLDSASLDDTMASAGLAGASLYSLIESGAVVLYSQARANRTLVEHAAADAEPVQKKTRSLGPQTEKQQGVQTTVKDAQAEQAEALIQAAEDGTPFCEECGANQ
ncbi:hypothetical protein [Agaribacterium haliotis]|uniref:hypothetical protein n=1 Tax=Agaribacterium haliotis TaxID=2013869 RepID=UPI00117819B6|nr:hypothetical protein [Agaribacterium haliotis]